MKKIKQPKPPKEIGWYKPDQKPTNVPGVYRTRVGGRGVGFSYFSGDKWGNQARDADDAKDVWDKYGASGTQNKEWCGLAVPAK